MTEVVGFFKSYDDYKFIIIDDDNDEIEMYFCEREDKKADFNKPEIKNIISFVNKRVCCFYNSEKCIIKEVSDDFKQVFYTISHNTGKRGGMSMDSFLNHILKNN